VVLQNYFDFTDPYLDLLLFKDSDARVEDQLPFECFVLSVTSEACKLGL